MGLKEWIMNLPIFRKYSKWEWEAGRIYLKYLDLSTGSPSDTPKERNLHLSAKAGMIPDCKARCKILGDKMKNEGQSYFQCIGKIKGSRVLHMWLELPDGTILEPTLKTTPKEKYICTERVFIKAKKKGYNA